MGPDKQKSAIGTPKPRNPESTLSGARVLALASVFAATLTACGTPDSTQTGTVDPQIVAEPDQQQAPEAVKASPRLLLTLAEDSFGLILYNLPERQLKFTVYAANNPQDKVEVISSGKKGNEGLHGVFVKKPAPAETKAPVYDPQTGKTQEQTVTATYIVEAKDAETDQPIPITDPGLNGGIEGDSIFY